jgi:hypothetical protein
MASSFKPSLQNLEKDGMIEFHGYYAAQEFFFRVYLENRAYAPLISNLQHWNWEVGDNKFLDELTKKLTEAEDWPRLKKLWVSVLSKRRKLYNQMIDIMRIDQKAIPLNHCDNVKGILLATLNRLLSMAE